MRSREALKTVQWRGITIYCDRPAGTVIEGTGADGQPYRVEYAVDYGFLPGVAGDDGDHYDAFVGTDATADAVYVVTQLRAHTGLYDEQKAMLGFPSADAAEACYRAHTAPQMFGGIASLSLDAFKAQLEAWRATGKADPSRADPTSTNTETQKTMTDETTQRAAAQPHPDPHNLSAAHAQTDPGQPLLRPRGLCVRAAELSAVREDAREVDFIMSTGTRDSYGEIVRQNWRLDRFAGNPVAPFGHKAHELPIGFWKNVRVEAGALRGTLKVVTVEANPLAECVWQSILQGSLRAVSVGFVPHKISYEEMDGEEICVLDDNELFECSPVTIPANPEALVEMKARAKAAFLASRGVEPVYAAGGALVGRTADTGSDPAPECKGAVPYEAFPPVETDSWDAANVIKRLRKWASSDGSGDPKHIDWLKYRQAFAWMDPQKSHEVGGFKLPHHDIRDGKLVTVKGGVVAAGNAIEGSRGGVKIPPGDMAAVKAHLAKHYKQFNLTPPWEASKSTESPVRAHTTETRMADQNVQTKDDDEVMAGVSCPECGHEMKASNMTEEGKKSFHGLVQRRAGVVAEARVRAAEEQVAELQKRNLELELNPLVGTKLAPEEVDGVLELGALWLSKGVDGRAKWEKHLKGISSRPDLSMRTGTSVLPREPAGNRTSEPGAADPTDDVIAKINKSAAEMPLLSA